MIAEFIKFHQHNLAYDPMVIWGLDHKCIYASKIYLEYVGVTEMVGKHLAEISEEYTLLGYEFRDKVSTKVIETKRPHICSYLLANRLSDDFSMHETLIFPIFDDAENLIAYCSKPSQLQHSMTTSKVLSNISSSNNINYRIQQTLTERERIIVFLLIIGLAHKEISSLLSTIYGEVIKLSSVSTMISRQIYSKFDTSTNSMLVQKAIAAGMLHNIPRRLVEHLPRIVFVEDYVLFCKRHGLIL